MNKLYPPYISGSLPAFVKNEGDLYLKIPYSMNPGVGKTNISGFYAIIKNSLGESIWSGSCDRFNDFEATFKILEKDNNFIPGLYYKIQLAYIGLTGETGYFSTIGVAKCIKQPQAFIANMISGQLNMHQNEYLGIYVDTNADCLPEKAYSYCFNVYDSYGNLYDTSGVLIHDSSKDIPEYLKNVVEDGVDYQNSTYDKFVISKGLENNRSYSISYTITTMNGYVMNSSTYRIMIKETIDPQINASLVAETNYENGYVDLRLVGQKNPITGFEEMTTGAFLIVRASDKDNYITWEEIYRFNLSAEKPSRLLYRDYTTEQGHMYKYAIQQYNDKGLYSNRLETEPIYSDFEDAFLFDGTRQLKIKYNPKISSFKTDVLETKIDTIGSKHPYIFRNGNVYYKEFPISGLVSYYMDEENIFTDKIINELDKTTNLVSNNIKNERQFKLSVLEWLNDGKVKLFRSPGEGNYIVRLMNVSMSPEDTLGRMLHSFSCMAYEVADYSYKELNNYDLIHIDIPDTKYLHFSTINLLISKEEEYTELEEYDPHKQYPTAKLLKVKYGNMEYLTGPIVNNPILTIRFTDMLPGDIIYLETDPIAADWDAEFYGRYYKKITIGATGSYLVDTGMEFLSIYIDPETPVQGAITYSYYTTVSNIFNDITNVENKDNPSAQIIGEHDVLKELQDFKTEILKIHSFKAQRRGLQIVYTLDGKTYYIDPNLQTQAPITVTTEGGSFRYEFEWLTNPDPFLIYKAMKKINNDWVFYKYIDTYNNKEYLNENDYQPSFVFNGNLIDLTIIDIYEATDLSNFESLICNMGTMIDCSYQIRIIDYELEETNSAVSTLKENYNKAFDKWINKPILDDYPEENAFNNEDNRLVVQRENEYNRKLTIDLYKQFVDALEKAYNEEQEAKK